VINHIDVSSVLRRTVCDLYSNLVTRPTGVAVRTEIEHLLDETGERTLTIIDFSNVNLLDFSCADEVVAKLILRTRAEERRNLYFVFRGVRDAHLEAIEAVLERHGLAVVVQYYDDGEWRLVGSVDDGERRAWQAVDRLGRACPADVADETGSDASTAARVLEDLHERRLVMRLDESYIAFNGLA
jgi:hypothetical protein